MAAQRRMNRSHLGDSWVVDEDSNGSDADWEEDAQQKVPQRKSSPASRSAKNPPSAPARRSSRASSVVPEPELIMPSIHEVQTFNSASHSKLEQDKPRKRTAKTSTAPNPNIQRLKETQREKARSTLANDSNKSQMLDSVLDMLTSIAEWALDIVAGALKSLKTPISWVLAAYLFLGLFTLLQNMLTRSIYSALSPICRIPGSSFFNLPMCESKFEGPTIDGGSAPVEFEELMTVQSHFEEIMEQSASGVSLPLDMKRSETSIRDLRQVVRFSQLHSRNEMVLEFDGFIETARIASYDLQKFNSHIGRGVDIVLSTARWTERVLDDMALKQSTRGLIPGFINDKLLAPFQPLQFTESRLLDQYIKHTRVISEEIEQLLAEAQALLLVLQNLEDRLDVIHGIAMRDNIHAQGSKDEVLSQLWTLLGGNRGALGKYNNQLRLLREVGSQRKVARAHVSSTILKLQAMGAELEELRERVGSAELLRDRANIPLAVHLESIRLGVERLEDGRKKARELESGHVRRVLDKAQESTLLGLES